MNWIHNLELLKNHTFSSNFDLSIAGPCAIESYTQLERTCQFLKSVGVNSIRGGAFKHRTTPYKFSGLKEEGLNILSDLGAKYNLTIVCTF